MFFYWTDSSLPVETMRPLCWIRALVPPPPAIYHRKLWELHSWTTNCAEFKSFLSGSFRSLTNPHFCKGFAFCSLIVKVGRLGFHWGDLDKFKVCSFCLSLVVNWSNVPHQWIVICEISSVCANGCCKWICKHNNSTISSLLNLLMQQNLDILKESVLCQINLIEWSTDRVVFLNGN